MEAPSNGTEAAGERGGGRGGSGRTGHAGWPFEKTRPQEVPAWVRSCRAIWELAQLRPLLGSMLDEQLHLHIDEITVAQHLVARLLAPCSRGGDSIVNGPTASPASTPSRPTARTSALPPFLHLTGAGARLEIRGRHLGPVRLLTGRGLEAAAEHAVQLQRAHPRLGHVLEAERDRRHDLVAAEVVETHVEPPGRDLGDVERRLHVQGSAPARRETARDERCARSTQSQQSQQSHGSNHSVARRVWKAHRPARQSVRAAVPARTPRSPRSPPVRGPPRGRCDPLRRQRGHAPRCGGGRRARPGR